MTRAKDPADYIDADPEHRAERARKAAAASRDPRRVVGKVADPVLAAEIAELAARRARELVAGGTFGPDVLARVAAMIDLIPKRSTTMGGAGKHGTSEASTPDDDVRELAESLTSGTELTWRIERNGLGDALLLVTGPCGDHYVGRTHGGFTVARPGHRGGEMCKSLDDVRTILIEGMGAYFTRTLMGR